MSSEIAENGHLAYTVVGYVSGAFGLAVAARNTIKGLLTSGRSVNLVDIDPGGGRFGVDPSYNSFKPAAATGQTRANIFHMNPLEISAFQRQWTRNVDYVNSMNVCVPFWELPRIPESWRVVLESMDVVLAPTLFIKNACDHEAKVTVIHYPQAAVLPSAISADRSRWLIPEDAVVFLSSFDPSSDIDRKNPWASVDAFRRAFGENPDALLLVRMHSWSRDPHHLREGERLQSLVSDSPNIRLLRDKLTYEEVLSLYASCDALVSLHRSEGLGLPLMEAMSLGKVAIATGWSGNMDFMRDENSCLVGYDLVPVSARHPAYASEAGRPGQVWAEPDIDDAAGAMRRVAADPELRARLGHRAKQDMALRTRDFLSGEVYLQLETALAEVAPGHLDAIERLRRTLRRSRREQRLLRVKRGIVLAGRFLHVLRPGD